MSEKPDLSLSEKSNDEEADEIKNDLPIINIKASSSRIETKKEPEPKSESDSDSEDQKPVNLEVKSMTKDPDHDSSKRHMAPLKLDQKVHSETKQDSGLKPKGKKEAWPQERKKSPDPSPP